MTLVASGTVRVRDLDTGAEWDEIVEVFEEDLTDTNGHELPPEDFADTLRISALSESSRSAIREVARRVAVNQASPATVETLGVDIE